MLEEKYGKLIILKPFNDDNGIVNNKQQKFVKQLQDITDEEGSKRAYETNVVYISIIINYISQAQRTFQSII